MNYEIVKGLQLPANRDIDESMALVCRVLFPEVFGPGSEDKLRHRFAADIGIAFSAQAFTCTDFDTTATSRVSTYEQSSADVISHEFMNRLPGVGRLLRADIQAVADNDPAVTSAIEVMCCYPAFTAMLHYRVAHVLHELGVPLLPRIITERAHERTGIDIHPAAQIGSAFGIDHGTGIVIGATSIIGEGVMVYQGVTLGAKHFCRDSEGHMIDLPRHPIIEDHVTIYSNTSLLGRIRIGHHSVIGGNLWITHDVPPHSQVRQSRAIQQMGFEGGEGI